MFCVQELREQTFEESGKGSRSRRFESSSGIESKHSFHFIKREGKKKKKKGYRYPL